MTSLPGAAPAAVIAFLAGAGVLALEITGARVFIPWFGSSVLVWTNVIGVTLGALALGNFVGGRLAERRPSARLLAGLLAAAAVLTVLVPYEVPLLAERYLPRGLELANAFALIGRASLVVAIATLGPPLVLLGAATPFLVRGAARDGKVARAAGLVSGAATIGSLVGTWVPVYWLVPSIGSRATCGVAGLALLLAAAVVVVGSARRRRGPAGALLVLFAVGTVLTLCGERGVGRAAERGVVLAELETRYQYARVERDATATALRMNEGLGSYHSLTVDGQLLTGGAYFDYYGLFPPLVARPGQPVDVLILGFAAGTIGRQLLGLYGEDPGVAIVGVELDPDVAALGAVFFGLPADDRLRVVSDQDGRVYLDCSAEKFDLIVVDTFSDQIYVPFQMCSREFFESAAEHLREGGAVVANLSGFSASDAPVEAIVNTAAAVFGGVALLRVDGGRNFVLIAGRTGPLDPRRPSRPYPAELEQVVAAARKLGAYQEYGPDPAVLVLTDDRSPIELLADRDLLDKSRRQLSREKTP